MKTMSRISANSFSRGQGVVAMAMLFMVSLLLMNGVLLACGQWHSAILNV